MNGHRIQFQLRLMERRSFKLNHHFEFAGPWFKSLSNTNFVPTVFRQLAIKYHSTGSTISLMALRINNNSFGYQIWRQWLNSDLHCLTCMCVDAVRFLYPVRRQLPKRECNSRINIEAFFGSSDISQCQGRGENCGARPSRQKGYATGVSGGSTH